MKKLMIANLKINNFRCLQNINLNFNATYNEISGRNGSGKTTILDAIRYLLFNSNDKNTKASNLNSVGNDQKPDIEGTFINGEKQFILKIKNGKYYYNDIEQKNSATYLEMIANNLHLKSIQDLSEFLHYTKLQETITSDKSNDKNDLINLLISLVNDRLNDANKIDPNKLDDIALQLENCNDQISLIKKDIKALQLKSVQIKSDNPNIQNWDNLLEINQSSINELKNRINKYDLISTNLSNYVNQLQQLELEQYNITQKMKNTHNDYSEESINKKPNGFITFLLTIITLGLYLLFRNKKPKNKSSDNVTSDLRNLDNQRKNVSMKIDSIKEEMKNYQNDLYYKNVDIESLRNQLHESRTYNSNEDFINEIKSKYNRCINVIKNYEKLLQQQNDKLTSLKNENIKNIEKIDASLNKFFNEYSVKLSSNDVNGKLNIYYKGVDFKHLNYAAKTNITLSISNFLKQKNGLQIFDLLDQRECINDLLNETQNQIIACKVTQDNELKLNGKNIH